MDQLQTNVERFARRMVEAARGLLELADRDRYSPTYGCFYYPFWRNKSSEYPNACFQEASYSLALLYRRDYPGNDIKGLLALREQARAGMLYWAKIQHPDGSFDEWYGGEHGFAATAFSSYALARAGKLLADELEAGDREALAAAFRRAAGWISRHEDLGKINHEIVGAAALFSLADALQDPGISELARKKLARVLALQTEEGWFPELGGLDTGYAFIVLEYLSRCHAFFPDDSLRRSIERLLAFAVHFVHPDMGTGWEYNSCRNHYVSLLAAAILSDFSPLARGLFREGMARDTFHDQITQDDLIRCYHLYSGLRTVDYYRERRDRFREEIAPLPFQSAPFRKYFPVSDMLAVRTGSYYALAAGRYAGLLKVFPYPAGEGAAPFSCHDHGYTLEPPGGPLLRSCLRSPDNRVSAPIGGNFSVAARFRPAGYFFPKRWMRFLLSLVSALPGGHLLIKRGLDIIRSRKKAPLQVAAVSGEASAWKLEREIEFREDRVEVADRIVPPGGAPAARVGFDLEIRRGVLAAERPLAGQGERLGGLLASQEGVVIRKTIAVTGGGIAVRVVW